MNECVRWWQHVNPQGYGELGKARWGGTRLAHRFIWEECFGDIPAGATIHHVCGNRACVNPEHLHLCRDAEERAAFLRGRGHEYGTPTREFATITLTDAQAARFWSRVNKAEGCWNWKGSAGRNGYGAFSPGGGRTFYAHRIAYTLAVGPIPAGLYVCHRCDNRRCCNPTHLFLATARENTQDMLAKGRHRSHSGGSKFDHGHARALRRDGFPIAAIARRLGVTPQAIRSALKAAA